MPPQDPTLPTYPLSDHSQTRNHYQRHARIRSILAERVRTFRLRLGVAQPPKRRRASKKCLIVGEGVLDFGGWESTCWRNLELSDFMEN